MHRSAVPAGVLAINPAGTWARAVAVSLTHAGQQSREQPVLATVHLDFIAD